MISTVTSFSSLGERERHIGYVWPLRGIGRHRDSDFTARLDAPAHRRRGCAHRTAVHCGSLSLLGRTPMDAMSIQHEERRPPKFLENSLLAVAGLLAHVPLYYQLPRWAKGLDPTFVHPRWIEQSSFPLFFHMTAVHPLVWVALTVVIFIRVCRNYGWRLSR